MNNFTFRGNTASSYGLKVGSINVYNSSNKQQEVFHVPGRIGDVAPADEPENWPNEYREYNVALYMKNASNQDVSKQFARIRSWLLANSGYSDLSDTYDPGLYRRAFFSGDFVPIRKGAGQDFEIPVIFNCDPRRFVSGITSYTTLISAGTNGTGRSPQSPQDYSCYPKCYPVLRIVGTNAAFSLALKHWSSGEQYGIISFAATNRTFTFDCETLECSEDGVVTDVSGELYMRDMQTQFARSGTSGAISVRPRWFVR